MTVGEEVQLDNAASVFAMTTSGAGRASSPSGQLGGSGREFAFHGHESQPFFEEVSVTSAVEDFPHIDIVLLVVERDGWGSGGDSGFRELHGQSDTISRVLQGLIAHQVRGFRTIGDRT
jgi:hypothetical protein